MPSELIIKEQSIVAERRLSLDGDTYYYQAVRTNNKHLFWLSAWKNNKIMLDIPFICDNINYARVAIKTISGIISPLRLTKTKLAHHDWLFSRQRFRIIPLNEPKDERNQSYSD